MSPAERREPEKLLVVMAFASIVVDGEREACRGGHRFYALASGLDRDDDPEPGEPSYPASGSS